MTTAARARVLLRLALTGMLLALAAVVGLRADGWQTLVVAGGSMEPAIPRGALVLVRPVAPAEVREGDVVTLRTPDGLVTHRVAGIGAGPRGREFTLRGDANPVNDVRRVAFSDRAGLVVAALPRVGDAVVLARSALRVAALAAGLGLLLAAALLGLRSRMLTRAQTIAGLRQALWVRPTDLTPHRRLVAMLLNNGDVEAALAEYARFEAALAAAGESERLVREREYRDATLRWTLAGLRDRALRASAA